MDIPTPTMPTLGHSSAATIAVLCSVGHWWTGSLKCQQQKETKGSRHTRPARPLPLSICRLAVPGTDGLVAGLIAGPFGLDPAGTVGAVDKDRNSKRGRPHARRPRAVQAGLFYSGYAGRSTCPTQGISRRCRVQGPQRICARRVGSLACSNPPSPPAVQRSPCRRTLRTPPSSRSSNQLRGSHRPACT